MAITAAAVSILGSVVFWFPSDWGGIAALNAVPFMNRMMWVFFLSLGLAILVSFLKPGAAGSDRIETADISYATSRSFNIAGFAVIGILIALYAAMW